MNKNIRRLPDSELEVMLALWEAQGEATRSWLDEELKSFEWSPNTVNTYLSRLLTKGFVSCRREGKANYYLPAIQKEEYLSFESQSVLSKLYGNSISSFVASLGNSRIGAEEIDELQNLLNELKGRENNG